MLKYLASLFFKKKDKSDLMNYFSEEYLEKLVNEHKLVSASISKLHSTWHKYISNASLNNNSSMGAQDIVLSALRQLESTKTQLEVKIDVLTEFLRD